MMCLGAAEPGKKEAPWGGTLETYHITLEDAVQTSLER